MCVHVCVGVCVCWLNAVTCVGVVTMCVCVCVHVEVCVCVCWLSAFTCVGVAGHAGVLQVVTVVSAPASVRALLQRQLISCALNPVQKDGPAALPEVGPCPGLRHSSV